MALIDLLPEYYGISPQVVGIQDAFNYYAEVLKDAKADLFKQIHVETATWGLMNMEKSLGIKSDVSDPIEFRRERIYAKLRGVGTITKAMIEHTAAAYSGGEVEIIEKPRTNSFAVKFVGTLGMPENMESLILTIEEIKPAHLSYTFEYVYNTHAVLSKFTYLHLSNYTYDQLRGESIS
jgi:Uncharacterized protein conserved in bacteria (DUF2313).